ncbi:MAG TPA: sugar phosphate isomerase/epimerase [Puia sp.]|nr:sugar phosphate isomerase/epimerase [Puia sp.]
MQTRRSFIRSGSLFSAGILANPSFGSLFDYKKPTIGLQLYTVRDAMKADPAGTLAKVAQIGYNSVEGATYTGTEKFYGMDPKSFAALLKQNGLMMPSSHYRLGEDNNEGTGELKGTMMHDWDRAVEDAAALGVSYMVCAWLSPKERQGLDHYKELASRLNTAGEKCKVAGIQLCYHNHDFEFDQQNGQFPYDVILDNSDKALVKLEIDMYWVTRAGQDPIALIGKHPGRFPLWHLKDMDKTPERSFTEVGNGTIDFPKIFTHAQEAGMKYFFVEQDKCPGSPFDSITQSIAYIKKNLV